MTKQAFRVVMKTSIGERCGILTAEWEDTEIHGNLEILDHANTFGGEIDVDGNCRIKGELWSLVRMIPYIAMGTISEKGMNLTLDAGRNIFEMVGVPFLEKEM